MVIAFIVALLASLIGCAVFAQIANPATFYPRPHYLTFEEAAEILKDPGAVLVVDPDGAREVDCYVSDGHGDHHDVTLEVAKHLIEARLVGENLLSDRITAYEWYPSIRATE